MAVFCGLDAAIMDVTSSEMRAAFAAAYALAGKDEYCMDYITFIRENEE
jgi:5-methyltetrahydrofolate--homocysteine methyltransferase